MIFPIEDFEDFLRIEEKAKEAAAENIQPWQRDLKPGDFFFRQHPVGITIYGEVQPVETDEDAPTPAEYRFTRCFSVVCPEGELGDIHISTVDGIITAEEFEAARARGWKMA